VLFFGLGTMLDEIPVGIDECAFACFLFLKSLKPSVSVTYRIQLLSVGWLLLDLG